MNETNVVCYVIFMQKVLVIVVKELKVLSFKYRRRHIDYKYKTIKN